MTNDLNVEILRVLGDLEERDVPYGEELIREGTPGREAFLLVEGSLDVTLRGESIASLAPGEFVGEMALLAHGPRSATVTARTDARVVVIGAPAFAQLLDRPRFVRKMASSLATRLRRTEGAPMY